MAQLLKKGSKIHIKKSHEGRFTEYCGGVVSDECIQRGKKSPDPKIRKQAVFAQNARKFKHQQGGMISSQPQINYNPNFVQDWQQQVNNKQQTFLNNMQLQQQHQQEMQQQKIQKAQQLGTGIGDAVASIGNMAYNYFNQKSNNNMPAGTVTGNSQSQIQPPMQTSTYNNQQLLQTPQLRAPIAPYNYVMMQQMKNGGNIQKLMNKIRNNERTLFNV